MSDVDTAVQNLAYLAAVKSLLSKAEAEQTAALIAAGRRRTEYPMDDQGNELGHVVVKDTGTMSVSIDDESAVLPWARDEFGEGVVETVTITRLTEQGRKSVIAAGKSGATIPGVTVTPAVRKLSVAVTPEKNVVELVRGMVSRGALSLTDVLAIEGAK